MADETVKVTMIGTGHAGQIEPGMAMTAIGSPNVKIGLIRPAVALAVRFAHLYLTTFIGLLTAAGIGAETVSITATFQEVVIGCGTSATLVAGVGFVKDLVTIFGDLEHKYPLASGSI